MKGQMNGKIQWCYLFKNRGSNNLEFGLCNARQFNICRVLTFAESPRTPSRSGEDWRSAFDSASNGPAAASSNSESRSRSADGRSRRYENGDVSTGANSGNRRTPNRLPPAPPRY